MIHVLCFGNELHGDDGFGVHVGRALDGRLEPGPARLFEVCGRVMDAVSLADGCAQLVLVDALRATGAPPGTLYEIDADAAQAFDGGVAHGGGVGWLVRAVRAAIRPCPRITLIGAVVLDCAPFDAGLSPDVALRVPDAAERVCRIVGGTAS